MTSLRLDLEPATITADTDARKVAGIAVPYGEPGNTSAGRLTVEAGALELPAALGRVKLL